MDRCAVCGVREELKRCGRCKRVCYCCREHQKSHWKIHKTECKPLISNATGDGLDSSAVCLDDVRIDCRNCQDLLAQSEWIERVMERYNLCILDGFLEESVGDSVLSEVQRLRRTGRMVPGQLSGGRTGSDDAKKFSDKLVRGDEIDWLEGCEDGCGSIGLLMSKVDALVVHCSSNGKLPGCSIHSRTKAMVACYPGNQTGYVRHVDNPDGDGRCLTAIYYLNKDWDAKGDGGSLRVFSPSDGIRIDIQPDINRLLMFWSDGRNPHEVLPSLRERYAITLWYFDLEQRRQAKVSYYQEAAILTSDQQRVVLSVELKKAQKDVAEAELHRKSAESVRNLLSEDDVKALSELIQQHPDNWQEIFDSFGIAPSIGQALLEIVHSRI